LNKIGIFGGTFDPIHHGHLILAREARETLDLNFVIFIPAAASPHKQGETLASGEVRLQMLRAAIDGETDFDCDAIELNRPPPSYAIDTMEVLRLRHQSSEFFYLIGEDNLPRLPTWHRFDELTRMVQFIVLNRTGMNSGSSYPMIRRHVDISATNIRNRVAAGRSIRYLVPPPVEEIIHNHQLYRESKQ
jgi:nicotinate-nucleotide adenylyltransferase